MKPPILVFAATLLLAIAGQAKAALVTNLVAYWNFEGNAANHSAGSGGAAFNGTLMGGATTTGTPKVGTGALLLDGIDNYTDVTTNVNVNQPWTVSAWFLPTVAPTGTVRGFVFESVGSTTTSGYAMSYGIREGTATTDTNFQIFTDNTPAADVSANFQVADSATLNTWHHIITVFTPATASATGSIIGYLDGVQRYNLVIPVNNTLIGDTGFHIGTYRGADGRWFTGSIDEVAIWNRGLSATEALEVYNKGLLGESFIGAKLTVSLTAAPANGGTVTGSGVYDLDGQAFVTATPAPGFLFSAWDGPFAGQPDSFFYNVTADTTSTATFVQDTADTDGDGLSNYEEIAIHHTFPNNNDSDGDLIPDGAEINITHTNPAEDDSALVNFVQSNLSVSTAGAFALGAPGIGRSQLGNEVSLTLQFLSSSNQADWSVVPLQSPHSSIQPVGDGFDVTLPAPSNSVNSYLLLHKLP